MKTKLLILSIILWFACDSPSQPMSSGTPEIEDTLVNYDQNTFELFIQVIVDDYQGLSSIDSVYVGFSTTDGTDILQRYLLFDDGLNADLLPGNGTYSGSYSSPEALEFGYYSFTAHVVDSTGNRSSFTRSIHIEEKIAPEIVSVEMEDFFELHETETTLLEISLTVYDPNGRDDIKWIRYYINTVGMYKDNPDTPECDREWGSGDDVYYSDPTWTMIYLEPGDDDDTYIYTTSIPMRPVVECGGTGDALFKFVVKDVSNMTGEIQDVSIGIYGCGDNFCTNSLENIETCPEDCR